MRGSMGRLTEKNGWIRPLSRGAGIDWCRFGCPFCSFFGCVFQPRRGRHRFGSVAFLRYRPPSSIIPFCHPHLAVRCEVCQCDIFSSIDLFWQNCSSGAVGPGQSVDLLFHHRAEESDIGSNCSDRTACLVSDWILAGKLSSPKQQHPYLLGHWSQPCLSLQWGLILFNRAVWFYPVNGRLLLFVSLTERPTACCHLSAVCVSAEMWHRSQEGDILGRRWCVWRRWQRYIIELCEDSSHLSPPSYTLVDIFAHLVLICVDTPQVNSF